MVEISNYLIYFKIKYKIRIYKSYEELELDFVSGDLHPGDLKPAVAIVLNDLIKPVRDHFTNNAEAKQLLETIKSYQVIFPNFFIM